MSSTSIPVVNRNNTLPPLLLPDLRSLSRHHHSQEHCHVHSHIHSHSGHDAASVAGPSDLFGLKRKGGLTESDENTLDRLATIALKRPKLNISGQGPHARAGVEAGASASANSNAVVNRLDVITPPPSAPVTAPVSAAISPSPAFLAVSDAQDQHSGDSSGAGGSSSNSPKTERKQAASSKRQRIGPSCDGCRLKKIKCDAKIEIFMQDESIIPLVSNNLHHIFTKEEIRENMNTLFQNVQLPSDLLESDDSSPNQSILIKHIDKIIHFQQCSSCRKKKNSSSPSHCCCEFSKGFTRADINVFSKIKARLKKDSIYEMDITDYKNAGF